MEIAESRVAMATRHSNRSWLATEMTRQHCSTLYISAREQDLKV